MWILILGNAVAKCIWRYRIMGDHLEKISGMKGTGRSKFDHNTHGTSGAMSVGKIDTESAERKIRKYAGE